MKRIRPFRYVEAFTVREALEILAEEKEGAYPLAGGTDLLVRMKRGDLAPRALVNLKRIPGLDGIDAGAGGDIRIGALAPIAAIVDAPLFSAGQRVLAEAAGVLGSPAIRNLGTLGGNIGRASPACDMAPSLMVLQARVLVEGLRGKREIGIGEFFKGPGSTVLDPGELIISFLLPSPASGTGAAYERVGRREGMDCALVGVAASVTLSGNDRELKDARVTLAAVAPVPLQARRAEEVLLSGPLTEARIGEAARAAAADCFPISDMRASGAYRREMVRVLTCRAVARALRSAEGGKD
ncbi:MAG: xanthine dehydrogenase family protein subunit M [Thermodesulfobacteriota bacterium]